MFTSLVPFNSSALGVSRWVGIASGFCFLLARVRIMIRRLLFVQFVGTLDMSSPGFDTTASSLMSAWPVCSLRSLCTGIAVSCGVRYRGLEYPVLLHMDFGDLRIQKYYWEEKAALRNSSHFLEERLYKDSYIEE